MPEAETRYQRKRRGSSRRTHGRHWLSSSDDPPPRDPCEDERRRLLALIEHNADGRCSMLFLRPWAFRWVDLLPTAEAQEAATAAIADACTPRDLKRILGGH